MNKKSLLIRPIASRGEAEEHRQSSWLELFIDVGFVTAIGSITAAVEEGFSFESLLHYVGSFLVIFWVWNRLTWYATFYDNGDVPFRLSFVASVFCVLGVGASAESLSEGGHVQFTLYYLLLELILIYLWSRVWRRSPSLADRTQAQHFCVSYFVGMLLVTASLWTGENTRILLWACAIFIEAVGPITAWLRLNSKVAVNSDHIVERHGLFALILLGEGVLAVSRNMSFPIPLSSMVPLVVVYGIIALLWWTYFDYGFGFASNLSNSSRKVFVFGYGQFFVFLALALITVSLEIGLYALNSNGGKTTAHNVDETVSLLLWCASAFILSMSTIQVIVSTVNPKPVYLLRFAGGSLIAVLAIFAGDLSFMAAAVTVFSVLLLIVINEIYHWGTLLQRSR